MAQKIFVRYPTRRPRFMPSIQHSVTSFLRDTVYSAETINEVLRSVFGATTLLDDPNSFAKQHGIKLALTAATVREPMEKVLLTNYNGYGERLQCCGRAILSPRAHRPAIFRHWLTLATDYRTMRGVAARLWEW